MLQSIPREILFIVVEDLSFYDLISLYSISKPIYLFFNTYFSERKNLDDPLILENWSPIKKYAAIESRTKIFLQAIFFVDLTTLIIRSIQLQDVAGFNLLWNNVIIEEDDNPSRCQVNYPTLIEKVFRLPIDYKVISKYLEIFLDQYQQLKAKPYTILRILKSLGTKEKTFSKILLLGTLIDKYVPTRYRMNSPFVGDHSQEDRENKIIEKILQGQNNNRPIIEAIINNRNKDLITLLSGRRVDDPELVDVISIGAIIAGRKDLLLLIKLGYIPLNFSIINTLELNSMKKWLEEQTPN